MTTTAAIDLERLFKLRAAVARFGEMDVSGWWNTKGVLGTLGAAVYKRGLPRTQFFARVRLVSAVAQQRSSVVYPAPGVATLWALPASLERALSLQERTWTAEASDHPEWGDFETSLQEPPADDLLGWLVSLGLIGEGVSADVTSLTEAPGGKGVEVPGPVQREAITLLAGGHARGGPKELLVPFIVDGLEADVG